jgi:phage gp36-like protein
MASGRSSLAVVLAAASARVVDGSGSSVDIGAVREWAELALHVTAVTGTATPTLAVTVETSLDGTTWYAAGAFPAITAPGRQVVRFANLKRYVRATWAVTGTTPSFTFGVSGDARIVYANLDDLAAYGAPAATLAKIDGDQKARALEQASAELDVHHEAARFELPLASWGTALRTRTCLVATWHLIRWRGFNPEAGSDIAIRTAYEDAIKAAKTGFDPEIVDATPEEDEGETYILSSPGVRW